MVGSDLRVVGRRVGDDRARPDDIRRVHQLVRRGGAIRVTLASLRPLQNLVVMDRLGIHGGGG